MDRIIRFQRTIETVMAEFVKEREGSNESEDQVTYKMIADEKQHRYQLVLTGWHKRERIYHVLFHVEINNNKIWIEEDNSEDSIAEMLVAHGISKKDIVLGYFTEFHRKHTEYAVA
jgi:XisI protein